MHNRKRIFLTFLKILLFFIGTFAVLVWGLNVVSQNEAITTRFIRFQIHRLLDLESEVVHPHAYVDWDLQYKIRADKLTFINNSKNLVSVEDLHVNVFLPYMFLRKIYITNMSGQNLYADFERYENKKINIIEIFNITGFFKIYFRNSSISVNKYKFDVLDKAHNPYEKMVITGDNVLISKFSKNKYLQLIFDGKIKYNNTITPFAVNYNVKLKDAKNKYNLELNLPDINLNTFKNYTKEFAPDFVLNGVGSIRAKASSGKYFNFNTTIKNVNIFNVKYPYSLKFNDEISLNSRLGIIDKDILIDELKISGKDFSTSASGKIFNPKKRPLDLILKVKIDENSNGNSILRILPNNIPILNHAIDKAKKHNVSGIAQGEALLKGKIGHILADGYVFINNITLGYGYDLPVSTVKLNFKKDKMYINGKHYPNYNKNEFVTIGGNIKITKPFFLDLQIDSTPNTDLVSTQKALNVYSNVLNFKTGPVETMKILKGRGEIKLSVKDTPPNVYLYGNMKFRNGVAVYPGLYGDLKNISGEIDFAGKNINYKNIKGVQDGVWAYAYGHTKVHENGLTHFYLNIPSAPLSMAKDFVDNSPLMKKVSVALKTIINPQGTGSLELLLISDKNTVKEPYVEGKVDVINSSCNIEKLAYRAKNVSGTVDFTAEKSNLNFTGTVNNILTKLSGFATQNYSELEITTENADIKNAYDFIYNSPMFEDNKNSFNDFSDFSGHIRTKTKIEGNLTSQAVSYTSEIDILDGRVKYLDYPEYINLSSGKIYAKADKVTLKNLKGNTLEAPFVLNGTVLSPGLSNENRTLVFEIKDLNVSTLDKIINTKLITDDVRKFLSKIDLKSGTIDVKTHIHNIENKANIVFHDACAVYMPTNEKISIPYGEFFYSNDVLKITKLFAQMTYSDFLIDGEIKNYLINPIYNVKLALNLSEQDFNKTLVPMFHLPLNLVGKVYANIDLMGSIDNWNVKSKAMLDDDSYILFRDANLGNDLSKYIYADIEGSYDDITINTVNVYAPTYSKSSDTPDVLAKISGKIMDINTDFPLAKNLHAEIFDYLNISFLNILFYNPEKEAPLFSKGLIKGKVLLNGDFQNPSIIGKVDVKEAIIPSINSTVQNMLIDFQNDKIKVSDAIVDIAGSISTISAIMSNKFTFPISIHKFELKSDLINSDKILESFAALFADNNDDNESIEPPQQPFIIEEGNVNVQKFVYNNLEANNFKADFFVGEDWNSSINNFSADFKDGTLNGFIDYNFYTTDLTGNIEVKDVMANDFATGFLNLPNEIFGKLTSNVKFSTKGNNHDEMVENLDGMVYFHLDKGRMIRLGSVEYMLRIANTVKSGISRLNLNAILNIVAPRTGYFDTIEGEVQIQDGTILADKITFQSPELNLFLTGSYNMNNSFVNGTIIGQMPKESKESILWLGSLGKISLNSLLKQLTRKVEKEQDNGFLYNPLAYINEIPGLKNKKSDYRFFVVDLKGDLYKDDYVKELKWIK